MKNRHIARVYWAISITRSEEHPHLVYYLEQSFFRILIILLSISQSLDMIVSDIVHSQKYLVMDKVLGKFVWSHENSEFKEVVSLGCYLRDLANWVFSGRA